MSAKELEKWPLITTMAPPSGCIAGFIGGFFTFCLGFYLLMTMFVETEDAEGMRPAVAILTAIFAVPFLYGWWRARRSQAWQRMTEEKSQTPWEWDHPWGDHSVGDRTAKRGKRLGCIALAAVAWMVPFNVAMFVERDYEGSTTVLVYDLAVLGLAGVAVYFALRRAKYGQMRLEFEQFPYHPGEEVEALMTGGAWMGELQSLTAIVRCVREEPKRHGDDVAQHAEALYEDVIRYQVAALQEARLDKLPIKFRVPDGLPVNRIQPASHVHTYWDLEIDARVPGVDYRGHFLVPVYARKGL